MERTDKLHLKEIDALENLIAMQITQLKLRIYDLQVTHKKLEAQRDYLLGLRPMEEKKALVEMGDE